MTAKESTKFSPETADREHCTSDVMAVVVAVCPLGLPPFVVVHPATNKIAIRRNSNTIEPTYFIRTSPTRISDYIF
jgi:hypothetical protein